MTKLNYLMRPSLAEGPHLQTSFSIKTMGETRAGTID